MSDRSHLPRIIQHLLRAAQKDGEGWTPQRLEDAVEAITALLAVEPHMARLLLQAAAQPRSLANLDASNLLTSLLRDRDDLALLRWLELERLRQALPVESDRLRAERLELEPHAMRTAPSEVAELRARAPVMPTTLPPAKTDDSVRAPVTHANAPDSGAAMTPVGPAPAKADSEALAAAEDDAADADAAPQPRAQRLAPPARPADQSPAAAWSEITLTATDRKIIEVVVRGVSWGSLTPPRDGRGSERLPMPWQMLLAVLVHEGQVGWSPDGRAGGRMMGHHRATGWRAFDTNITLNTFEGRISTLRNDLKRAFGIKADDPIPSVSDEDQGGPQSVYRAKFVAKCEMAPEDFGA